MKHIWKRSAAVLLAGTVFFGSSIAVFAEKKTQDQEVVVEKGDKPFLALGEDLSKKQRDIVLDLMGIEEEDLDAYDVTYVSNEQEHEFLDSYIPKSKIGTNALSSVVVMQGKSGSGVNVTTKNINYCTTGMYENAMITAGLTDAEAIVAAPSEISGTAALIGVIEAYSAMTGEEINEENIDAAFNEMVITGQIEESTGSQEQAEGMIAYLKEQVADGSVKTEKDMEEAIADASQKFELTLTPEQEQQLLELLKKLESIDLNLEDIKDQAQNIYDKLSEMGVDLDVLGQEAKGFFARLWQSIKDFFTNLFG